MIGIQALRPHQSAALCNIFKSVDQIVSVATSGGKSLIYTLPTVVYGKITIVVTPTIVLRND